MPQLFIPGPVEVAPEILAAQAQQMMPHRSVEFEKIFKRAAEKSRKLFGTEERVFLTACSGTGMHEAAVRNLAKESVLCCVNGAFGKRWHDVALSNGKSAQSLEVEWGHPVTPEIVGNVLNKRHFEIITVVHNETSTGVENPVERIAEAVHETSPDTLICVDAVSSLGGARIEMDKWGADLVLSSSQKCLALPPGLALCAVSERALKRAENVPNRGWYFDLLRLEQHRLRDSTPATSPVPLIYALDKQLDRILNEGLEARFARHRKMAELVQNWTISSGLGLFAAENHRSPTVTAVSNSLDLDFSTLNDYLVSQGMCIANGYGPLKGETFRIAHMGETLPADIHRLLEVLDEFLSNL